MYQTKFNMVAFCFLSVLIISACSANSVPVKEYVSYILSSEHGLQQNREANGVVYTMQYKPVEYVALQYDPEHSYNSAEYEEHFKELQGYYYFNIKIASKDGRPLLENNENSQEHFDMLNYCEFSMKKDFKLIEGKDTVPCEIYNFERNYNLAPFNNFILAFKNIGNVKKDLKLIYTDKLFNVGKLEFAIRKQDIEHIPAIKS